MFIPFSGIISKYGLSIRGAIQVGAHFCEEHDELLKCGITKLVYIEPCGSAFNEMNNRIFTSAAKGSIIDRFRIKEMDGISVRDGKLYIAMFKRACGEVEGEFEMYVSNANQGQSNSLLQPLLHLQQHPEVVFTDKETIMVSRLDTFPIKKQDYNMLIMDVQGAEGLVLKGATETLKYIDLIYTEINRGATYAGNMEIDEMDAFLKDFSRVETYWPSPNWTWGDAAYIRTSLLQKSN